MKKNESFLIRHSLPCDDCGSSDAKAEYVNNFYCWSCQKSTKKKFNPEDLLNYQPRNTVTTESLSDVKFGPISDAGKVYLYKYFITDKVAKQFKIGSTKELEYQGKTYGERLLFPGYINNELKFIEARALGEQIPKFITLGNKSELFEIEHPNYPEIVCIVEDMVSAIRLSKFVSVAALRGTHLSEKNTIYLLNKYNRCIVWLDNDAPGKKAAQNMIHRLRWIFKKTVLMSDLEEPKKYPDEVLEDQINNGINEITKW